MSWHLFMFQFLSRFQPSVSLAYTSQWLVLHSVWSVVHQTAIPPQQSTGWRIYSTSNALGLTTESLWIIQVIIVLYCVLIYFTVDCKRKIFVTWIAGSKASDGYSQFFGMIYCIFSILCWMFYRTRWGWFCCRFTKTIIYRRLLYTCVHIYIHTFIHAGLKILNTQLVGLLWPANCVQIVDVF